MEKSPIFDKLKDKVTSLKDGITPVDEEYTQTEQDVLEQFRIPQSIEIPEDVMTTAEVEKIRFPKSKPTGFHPPSVEEFHRQAKASIKFYLAKLEKRDRDIHKLATEVDKYKTDFMNTKYQLELFQGAGGQAMVGENGEYLTEGDLGEREKALIEKDNEIVDLQNKIMLLQADLQRERETSGGGGSLTDEERMELNNYRENEENLALWEAQVKDSYSALEDENHRILNELDMLRQSTNGSDQTEKINELITAKNELEQYVDQAFETNEELNKSIDALEAEKTTWESEKSQLATSIQEKEQQILELSEEVTTVNQKLEEVQNNNNDELVAKLQTEIEELTDGYNKSVDFAEELEGQIESLKTELLKTKTELEEATSTSAQTDEDSSVESMTAHIEQLDAHIDTLEGMIADRDAQLEKQYEEISKLSSEIESLKDSKRMGTHVVDGYVLPEGVTPEDLGL